MKLLLVFISIFISFITQAQEVGLHYSTTGAREYLKKTRPNQTIGLGNRIGLSYQNNLLKKSKIDIGLYLTQVNIAYKLKDLESNSYTSHQVTNRNNYLEISSIYKTMIIKPRRYLNTYFTAGYSYSSHLYTIKFFRKNTNGFDESEGDFEPQQALHGINTGIEFIHSVGNKFYASIHPKYFLYFPDRFIWSNNIKSIHLDLTIRFKIPDKPFKLH